MRIAVIGAGIVGVTTAYELAQDGHEVAVFERNGSVAAGASFAHAGIVAPACVLPWTLSGKPRGGQWPVQLDTWSERARLAWAWKEWRSRGASIERAPMLALHQLAAFSQRRLHELRRHLRLDYERSEGLLMLLRTADELAQVQPMLAKLGGLGIKHSALDADGCRKAEPGLNVEAPLHAGIYLPDAEIGNCRQFANLLRAAAQRLGVRFRYHTDVRQITPGPQPQVTRLYAPPEDKPAASSTHDPRDDDEGAPTQPMAFEAVTERFDAVVVCAALGAGPLIAPLGLALPMAAVYGYSITAPMRRDEQHPELGPRAGVIDQHRQVAITRIGARIRVSGTSELGGTPTQHNPAALDALYKVVHDWFPGVARLAHALPWKGLRPTLPDGRPAVGPSPAPGVWLNLGHGAHGFALACGSARMLADLLAGREPAVVVDPFSPLRFRT
jgi:D-amino-acid dehydrogenase